MIVLNAVPKYMGVVRFSEGRKMFLIESVNSAK